MRIIFIGTVLFSKDMLEKLIYLNQNIVGIITAPNNKINSDYYDFKPLALKYTIPLVETFNTNNEEIYTWMEDKNPDIIFCIGWSRLIGHRILKLPKHGVIGFHPTELPKNRGRHPIIWALVLGLQKTATSFFIMDEGADTGDIVSQKEIVIEYEDDAMKLYNKIIDAATIQIENIINDLNNNKLVKISQSGKDSNSWRKRTMLDSKIDFRMTSKAIYNLVRALTHPYIGAFIEYGGKEIKIWKVKEVFNLENNIEYGKVIEIMNNEILVKCQENAILIQNHEFIELPKIGEYFNT